MSTEIKYKNKDILKLNRLSNIKDVPTYKLNKLIHKTLREIEVFCKFHGIDNKIPKTELYLQYEKELDEGYKKLASGAGPVPKTKIIITQQGEQTVLDFDINSIEASNLRVSLEVKYAEALTERQEQYKTYLNWLEEDCEETFNFEYITVDDMPTIDGNYKELWDTLGLLIR